MVSLLHLAGLAVRVDATVVLADTAVISALALAQQHLVPAVLIEDNTTWMLPLACTSVYILQIALRPRLGLLGAAIVVIAYGLGSGQPADGWLLVVGRSSPPDWWR